MVFIPLIPYVFQKKEIRCIRLFIKIGMASLFEKQNRIHLAYRHFIFNSDSYHGLPDYPRLYPLCQHPNT